MGRAVQIAVVQGCSIVRCQKLLLFSLLLGLYFQFFFKRESFPAPNFWGKKSVHMSVNNLDEGCVAAGQGVADRGQERSAASRSEEHSQLFSITYIQPFFFTPPPFISSSLWSDIKTALLVWDLQWSYSPFMSFFSFVFFSVRTQSVNWFPVVRIKASSCHVETPSSQ